jgi:UDP-N-acetylglucosamine--N-acetylmuramyl-(pentapeptide) pyrophosphoryl-undecaprenol N-acetylglucosamine transferase
MNNQTIAFVAGRSGGHIIPALTVAQHIKKEFPHTKIIFFTTTHTLDKDIIKEQGAIVDKHIPLSLNTVPLLNPLKIALFAIQFVIAFFKCCSYLRAYRPTKVIGMGGYISLPVCWAAQLLHIPIELYDLDALPGKATRALKYHAQKIYTCFEEARVYLPTHKIELIAYPLRFSSQDSLITHAQAIAHMNFSPNKKTVFINGGSQGSIFINDRIKEWLSFNEHLHSLIQIIHQVGSHDTTDWTAYYKNLEIGAVVFSYRDDLAPCYQAADIIIGRAGAGSLFEALFFNKPCLIIPLETSSTSHQKNNGQAFCTKYPHLFTMITHDEIKKDNMILFSALNKYVHAAPKPIPIQTAQPLY